MKTNRILKAAVGGAILAVAVAAQATMVVNVGTVTTVLSTSDLKLTSTVDTPFVYAVNAGGTVSAITINPPEGNVTVGPAPSGFSFTSTVATYPFSCSSIAGDTHDTGGDNSTSGQLANNVFGSVEYTAGADLTMSMANLTLSRSYQLQLWFVGNTGDSRQWDIAVDTGSGYQTYVSDFTLPQATTPVNYLATFIADSSTVDIKIAYLGFGNPYVSAILLQELAVPEPSSLMLLLLGGATLWRFAGRRGRKS